MSSLRYTAFRGAAGVGSQSGRGSFASSIPAATNEATLDLNIVYVDGKIWNPSVQRFDAVKLRSYQGTRTDPDAPFVSPTLEINPGDTIKYTVTITNNGTGLAIPMA